MIELELNDGEFYEVTDTKLNEWQRLYPAIDVLTEVRKMSAWLTANPAKRKTARGIQRFCVNWLSRAQDRGGSPSHTKLGLGPDYNHPAEVAHWVEMGCDREEIARLKIKAHGFYLLHGERHES